MTETAQRQFIRFVGFAVFVGYLSAALLGPPDPYIQQWLAIGCIGVGIGVAYWLVYRATSTPTVRVDDVFRWFVNTAIFIFSIQFLSLHVLPINAVTRSWQFESVVGLLGTVIAAVVVWSDRVPWPGDR